MLYRQNLAGCKNSTGVAGLSNKELKAYLNRTKPFLKNLRKAYKSNELPLLKIGAQTKDLDTGLSVFMPFLEGAENLVILGTGGSSLGGQALVQIAEESNVQVHFLHNLDARILNRTFKRFDLKKTRILSISKSGNTPETLTQTILVLDIFIKAGWENRIKDYFMAITEPVMDNAFNGLREICQKYDIPLLPHDPDIGGRYSAFTTVGLLPAMAAGLDPHAVRRGANRVIEEMLSTKKPKNFAPAVGAALTFGLLEKRNIQSSVLMPYAEQLNAFTFWFTQLWAESLGKEGSGTIPVAAIGPADQHSMLQLFLDGPPIFLMNLIFVGQSYPGPRIEASLARLAHAEFLVGHNIGELINAQQQAIRDSFIKTGRPVRTFEIDTLNEETLGALMMHFMLETILTARLLGIDPFNQPAVELGKQLTRKYLSRDNRQKIKNSKKKDRMALSRKTG